MRSMIQSGRRITKISASLYQGPLEWPVVNYPYIAEPVAGSAFTPGPGLAPRAAGGGGDITSMTHPARPDPACAQLGSHHPAPRPLAGVKALLTL